MDWLSIGKTLLGLGLPVLGTALLGPAGGTVGGMIARALGVDGTPEAVGAAIATTDQDVLVQKLKSTEGEYTAYVTAQADLGKIASQTVADTMKAELIASHAELGWFGVFQRAWRPLFAYELLGECTLMAVIMAHEVWTADFSTLSAIMQFQGFLTWYYGLRFGVIGVFAIGRSQEKVAVIKSTTEADSGLIGKIVADVMSRIRR
jgi:hypothetical protein